MQKDHERDSMLYGKQVAAWYTQTEVGEVLSISPRHVRRLERVGLPSEVRGNRKRYPMPHVLFWYIVHKTIEGRGEVVERLCPEYALVAYRELVARDQAEVDRKLVTRRRRYR